MKQGTIKQGMKRFFLKILLVVIVIGIIGALTAVMLSNTVKRGAEDSLVYVVTGDLEINPVSAAGLREFDADCILVLGAGIKDEETPSDMLRDRLDVGIELYKEGLAPKLLLSGDNGQVEYNEIHVMFQYAKNAGVPAEDIFCDHAGFSTYDSMHRAGSIFGVERAIVVTQEYHQYRALYIGRKLGLQVQGVASDQRNYFGQSYREGREMLARVKDLFKSFFRMDPVLGGDVIPISGSGILSHDE